MRPAISQVCSLHAPFERDVEGYAAGNCEAMDVWLTKLETFVESRSVGEARELLDKNRIRAELLRLARDHVRSENTAEISPLPIHADIANRVSTHREAVTRELNALERVGLIERHDGTLIIRDVARLARSVEEDFGK